LSTTFCDRVTPSTEAEVKKHIHWPNLRFDPQVSPLGEFPFAVVTNGTRTLERQSNGSGGGNNFFPTGTLTMRLADCNRDPSNLGNAEQNFANWIADVVDDVNNEAGKDDRLVITGIEQKEEISISPDGAQVPYLHAEFDVSWGI
jgi:hypothetical protein